MTTNEKPLTEEMIAGMNGNNQTLYRVLWGEQNNDFWNKVKVKKTLTNKNTESDNSYSFYGADDKCELLKGVFEIKNTGLFDTKYKMAVSGSGQEKRRITTLHSSSLCALLFFYNVSKNNPLVLPLKTNKGERIVEFTKSVFEFKNTVISGRSPSNVDVVLIGKIKEGKDVVLFLESKFAEYYLSSGSTCEIGEGYLTNKIGAELYKIKGNLNEKLNDMPADETEYKLERLTDLNLQIKKTKQRKNGKEVNVYKLSSGDTFYIHGIKQMISHYIGIKNLIHKDFYKSKLRKADEKRLTENEKNIRKLEEKIQTPIEKAINTGNCIVILGEITFELPNKDAKTALKKYRDNYKLLAEIIAKQEPENSKFEILKDLLLYSKITEGEKNNYKVDEKVKLFYGMN